MGLLEDRRISSKHISVAMATEDSLKDAILNSSFKMLCINDVRLSEEKFERLRSVIVESFETKFPRPSKFELH